VNTTFPLTPIAAPDLNKIARPTDVVAPVERVRLFSDEQFESFIAEWAISCIKPSCKEVYNLGGAGDMGRDVIAEFSDGSSFFSPVSSSSCSIHFQKTTMLLFSPFRTLPPSA